MGEEVVGIADWVCSLAEVVEEVSFAGLAKWLFWCHAPKHPLGASSWCEAGCEQGLR